MSHIDLEALQQKVRQLESSNKRLRAAGGLLATVIGAGLMTGMTQDRYMNTVRTQELVIEDEAGNPVVVLGGSGLELRSAAGSLSLTRGEGAPQLSMATPDGAELTLAPARLVAEKGGEKRFDLRVQEDHTQLQVLGAGTEVGSQPPGVWMESTGDGGQVGIHDRNFIRAVLGELVLQDASGRQTTLPSSTLSLYDAEGNLSDRIPRQ